MTSSQFEDEIRSTSVSIRTKQAAQVAADLAKKEEEEERSAAVELVRVLAPEAEDVFETAESAAEGLIELGTLTGESSVEYILRWRGGRGGFGRQLRVKFDFGKGTIVEEITGVPSPLSTDPSQPNFSRGHFEDLVRTLMMKVR